MDNMKQYLLDLTPASTSDWARSLEQYASEHRVPIMEKDSMHFLAQLVRIHAPKTILELGTAIGYSALRMHEAYPEAHITTLEKNEEMYAIAKQNIAGENKQDNIKVIEGDALDSIKQLAQAGDKFDFIFIDAAKGQYQKFFTAVEPLLTDKGLIVSDNILFRGFVANPSLAPHPRLEKLAKKIANFNIWLMEQSSYQTSIIPIGDGVAISVKK